VQSWSLVALLSLVASDDPGVWLSVTELKQEAFSTSDGLYGTGEGLALLELISTNATCCIASWHLRTFS
jgi:hypothetical protein